MIWEPRVLLDENSSSPSGGAAATPASSPPEGGSGGGSAPTPETIARMPDTDGPVDTNHDAFEGMDDNDFDLVEVSTEEAAPQVGETGKAPLSQPPAEPEQKPATAAEAAPQAAAQQPPVPATDGSQPRPPPLEQAIEGFRTNHKQLSEWASTNLFALSKEDAELLETDAVAAIPLLMGRVYSQALQATTNLMKNFIPDMINQGVATTNARTAKANEALSQFYGANPHLNPQQHGALVDKWARSFRAANPGASRSEAIKFVGNAVSAELGIHSAPAGANGSRQRAAPFAPARPGTRVQPPASQHDPYEGMDMEYDQQ